jgi:hypothetical protein
MFWVGNEVIEILIMFLNIFKGKNCKSRFLNPTTWTLVIKKNVLMNAMLLTLIDNMLPIFFNDKNNKQTKCCLLTF